jgi:uncharacterized membrane protein YgdD (TMEM256/DUF423 family)
MRWTVLMAGLLGACGVGVGAFAAHGLEASLVSQGLAAEEVADRLRQCDVAVRYHMFHTLALLIIGLYRQPLTRGAAIASFLFLVGIGLFSGGLYSMVFLGKMGHWAIVPLGGLCFLLGWLCTLGLAWDKVREK